MPLPIPDKGRVLFAEDCITTPTADKVARAYDLTLYPQVGNSDAAVLEVYTRLQFTYVNGTATDGSTLTWMPAEKKVYARKFCDAVLAVWNNRHVIKDTSGNAQWKEIAVVFDMDYWIDSVVSTRHWELQVKKVDQFSVSFIAQTKNSGVMDNQDVDMTVKIGATPTTPAVSQRPAAHEFGHCLGLNDEYVTSGGWHNPHYTWDADSVLHSGEEVRERHYAPFADWLTRQLEYSGANRLLRKNGYSTIKYKVNGTTDLTTAKL